jgi:hypothetical protein
MIRVTPGPRRSGKNRARCSCTGASGDGGGGLHGVVASHDVHAQDPGDQTGAAEERLSRCYCFACIQDISSFRAGLVRLLGYRASTSRPAQNRVRQRPGDPDKVLQHQLVAGPGDVTWISLR